MEESNVNAGKNIEHTVHTTQTERKDHARMLECNKIAPPCSCSCSPCHVLKKIVIKVYKLMDKTVKNR